jgi:hypothetical protein
VIGEVQVEAGARSREQWKLAWLRREPKASVVLADVDVLPGAGPEVMVIDGLPLVEIAARARRV